MISQINVQTSKIQRISWKFLSILIPLIALAAIVVLAIFVRTKFHIGEKNLLKKIELISSVHSMAVAHPLWTLDYGALDRSMQTIVLYPEVYCAEVLEKNEPSNYQWPRNCVNQFAGQRLVTTELQLQNQIIGNLKLYYTTDPLSKELQRDVLIWALFFLILCVISGLVAYGALRYIVGRPVHRLMASIHKTETDDVREPVVWSSKDELGSVIDAYNNMLRQVEANTNELIAAREQAELAASTKSRFLANMSHELRTPLNAVIGITEMLREEAEDENIDTEPYDRIAGSGRHLLQLIDDILDISKIEANKIDIVLEEVELLELLDDVIATAQSLADDRGNSLTLNYSGSPETLKTDALRLRQIIINLLSNACKFTENGSVVLAVSEIRIAGKSNVCFSVEDTGIGIADDRRDQLFKDFSQIDSSTTREYGGTGLGLAISQRLCMLLGSKIELESTLGQGSRFRFVLPVGVVKVSHSEGTK